MFFEERQERNDVVDRFGRSRRRGRLGGLDDLFVGSLRRTLGRLLGGPCLSGLLLSHTRRGRLRNRHRLHGFRTDLGRRLLHASSALLTTNRGTSHEDPADVRNRFAPDQTAFVKEPRVLPVEFLIAVVRQDAGPHLLGDHEHEGITAPDRSRRWRHQLVVGDRLVEFGDLLAIDTVTERGVDHHGDDVLRVLGHEGHHGVVQLLQARLRASFGGDVRTVDDHVASHGDQ